MELATQSWFEGAWAIRREIDDRAHGRAGLMVGRADFVTAEGGLDYAEEGVLQLGGQLFPAGRRYLWRFDDSGRVRMLFEDGRPFHSFLPGRPVADHLCGDDRYAVAYTFADDSWTSRWEVRGPRKDYVALTRFRRIAAEHVEATDAARSRGSDAEDPPRRPERV